MPDADLIVPGDRLFTVKVTKSWTAYVVAQSPEEAAAIGRETDEDLTATVETWTKYRTRPAQTGDGASIPWGHSLTLDGRQLTVNEVVALLAGEESGG